MKNAKERYYKVWDGRNRLMFITPEIANAREFVGDLLGRTLTAIEFNVTRNNARFIDGFRIEMCQI